MRRKSFLWGMLAGVTLCALAAWSLHLATRSNTVKPTVNSAAIAPLVPAEAVQAVYNFEGDGLPKAIPLDRKPRTLDKKAVPRGWQKRSINGMDYYIVPLST